MGKPPPPQMGKGHSVKEENKENAARNNESMKSLNDSTKASASSMENSGPKRAPVAQAA